MNKNNIGSCIMLGLKGETLTHQEKRFIESEDIGAVLLFKRNAQSYPALKELCKSLLLLKISSPLIIAIDREGGVVDRLTDIPELVPWPNPSLLVHKLSLKEVEHTSYLLHQELKHFGINMNLSPCLDLSHSSSLVLKNRTISKNPFTVGLTGYAFIQGARRAGILSCAKHFPGHGGVCEDSHLTLPVDSSSYEKILHSIWPFRYAFAGQVQSSMLAHILYSALDSQRPASASDFIIQKLLRNKLQFSGLILTDDLDMKAVSQDSCFAEKSLKAGAQMLICGNGMDTADRLLKELKKNKKNDPLIEQRKKEILHFKRKYIQNLIPSFPPLNRHRHLWQNQILQKLSKK